MLYTCLNDKKGKKNEINGFRGIFINTFNAKWTINVFML